MIVTRKIAIRIGLILLLTVIVQNSFFSYLSFLGAAPDVVPVVIVCLGLLGGGVLGAVCGFLAGLLVDSTLLQTLGVSSLVLLSIGYLAGRYREGASISSRWVPPLIAGALTMLGAAGFAAIELMLGVDAPVSVLVVREIVVQGLLAVVLALAVYPLVRFILSPALVDYVPSRRLLGLRGRRRRGAHARGRGRGRRSRQAATRARRAPIGGGVA